MTGPLTLMIVGSLLAVFGFTRKMPAGCDARVRRAAGLRFVWDVTGGVLAGLLWFTVRRAAGKGVKVPGSGEK